MITLIGTTLYYNKVILRDCELLGFDQHVEYDESHTDVVYSKFSIRVASTLVGLASAPMIDATGATYSEQNHATIILYDDLQTITMPERLAKVQALLSESRKDFAFQVGPIINEASGAQEALGQTLLMATGVLPTGASETDSRDEHEWSKIVSSNPKVYRGNVIDVNLGPKPIDVKVVQIFGGRTIRVEFEIEVSRCVCPGGVDNSNPPESSLAGRGDNTAVLSNRWAISESKGEDWKTTRRLTGTLRVRDQRYWAHAMRYLCVPPLLRGYKRISQDFATDKTGLTLTYTIEDREQHAAPPPDCIDWNGNFSLTQGRTQGKVMVDCSVRVVGPPGANKQVLMDRALQVIFQRTGWRGGPTATLDGVSRNVVLENFVASEVMQEPIVDLRLLLTMVPAEQANNLSLMGGDWRSFIGRTLSFPGYDASQWYTPLPFDSTTPAGLFTCYLQSPCSKWHGMPGQHDDYLQNKANVGSNYNQVVYSPNPDLTRPPNWNAWEVSSQVLNEIAIPKNLSSFQYDQPYTFIELDDSYKTDEGIVGLPLSASRSVRTGAGSSTTNENTAVIRLHQPICRYSIQLIARRERGWPKIPDPGKVFSLGSIKATRTALNITLETPENLPDMSQQVFSVHVRMDYVLSRAPESADQLRFSGNPITKANPTNYLPVSGLFGSV